MKKLIIANWKAHPATTAQASALAHAVELVLPARASLDIVVMPPVPFLGVVGPLLSRARLGAQDVFWDGGAYTGATSSAQLRSLGVTMVLVGHSERRTHMGETDEMVEKKLHAALGAGLAAVLCVGEKERHGSDLSAAVGEQLRSALRDLPKERLTRLVIAYEPVWAISTAPVDGTNADTPDHAFRARLYIEKMLVSLFGARLARDVRVIYGGSVIPSNVAAFLTDGHMDGVLVGSASLDAKKFGAIATEAARTAAEIVRR